MAEQNPIERNPSPSRGETLRCEDWECLIAEALDGTLPAGDRAIFEQHRQGCAACAQMLEQARQGALWLGFLEREPEMPADMLEKILARTSGAGVSLPAAQAKIVAPPPFWSRIALPVAQRVIEPRLVMTLAMAFFSLALTLNLAGIKLSEVRLSDLRPSSLSATLTRQYYSAHGSVMRYYENLRFVNEMEARVRELRQSTETEAAPAPENPSPVSRNGSTGQGAPESAAGNSSAPRRDERQVHPDHNALAEPTPVNEAGRSGQEPLDPFIKASQPSPAAQRERAGGAGNCPSTTQARGERNFA